MPHSEHKKHTLEAIEQEIESLRLQLEKKKELRDSLNQQILSLGSHETGSLDKIALVREAERLEKLVSEIQIDIQHLDTRIWRLRHRADRIHHDIV